MSGDPLDMVTYGIGVLPLIKRLKAAHPDITHPWYAEYSGALGMYDNIKLYCNLLKYSVLGHEY